MKLRCLAIDDEPPALKLIQRFVKRVDFLEISYATTNAIEAADWLETNSVDLLFIDIQMPDITGIQFLQALKDPPMVVFTTAYEQYALKGYELNIVDYLLKPIPFKRFEQAAQKAKELHQQRQASSSALPSIVGEYLFVKADYQIKKIAFSEIRYIEGLKDYIKIYSDSGMTVTRQNLKGITPKLPADNFIRVHRSYIVSFRKVDAFQKSKLTIGKKEIPVGDNYRDDLFRLLDI